VTSTNRAGGGELLDNLTKQTHITETEIAGYIRQVLWGLEYMHNQNIAHLGLTVSDCIMTVQYWSVRVYPEVSRMS
jgi:serine/threonine protein kinase